MRKRSIELWEKEKMLLTSIFSFSHNVFYPMIDKFYDMKNICRLQILFKLDKT